MEGYADRPALGQRAVEFVTDPQTGRTSARAAAPVRDHHLPRAVGPRRRGRQRPGRRHRGAARRPRLRAGLHQRRLHDDRHGAWSSSARCRVPLQTSAPVAQLRPIVAETEPRVIAASIDYLDDAVELVADRPHARAAGRVRLPPRGGRPARGVRGRPDAAGGSGQPGDRGNAGRRARTRDGAAGRAGVRSRRGRPVDVADLHLRQHRRAEGRHVPRAPGRQLVAQVAAGTGASRAPSRRSRSASCR